MAEALLRVESVVKRFGGFQALGGVTLPPIIASYVYAVAAEAHQMQGIAAEKPKPRVTIYGHRWDSVCSDLRRFLARNQITQRRYRRVDVWKEANLSGQSLDHWSKIRQVIGALF